MCLVRGGTDGIECRLVAGLCLCHAGTGRLLRCPQRRAHLPPADDQCGRDTDSRDRSSSQRPYSLKIHNPLLDIELRVVRERQDPADAPGDQRVLLVLVLRLQLTREVPFASPFGVFHIGVDSVSEIP
ncbi:hypothetical protein CEB94_14750 [Streptomyces hawaiiensis]|uniref:Uncharacterized protein n=1 Tax=Streptomyces hawaiiensis TaxID=67305 RepID=A0A6G5RDU3_9ACTN|nr:hypothetical protein CEB94_14750 [Streptomyces hawaiiensis]